MSSKYGIVGLPNVGKSTLFNAITQTAKAQAENYPFCTIEPNIGMVEVPDIRLIKVAEIERSEKITPTFVEFVDIAGLVKGASKGEGLGNQFLAHIREVDAIVHVLRCFEDENIVHVEGSVNPVRDTKIIDLELIAKDMETVENRLQKVEKMAKGGNKEARKELEYLSFIKGILEDLEPLRKKELGEDILSYINRTLFLLTVKPVIYVANISEKDLPDGGDNKYVKEVKKLAQEERTSVIVLCAELEAQLVALEEEEKKDMLKAYGLDEPALNKLIREAYRVLNFITFFTAGPKETRAWTIKRGTKAKEAAGKIHSDMEKGFIAAEVINWKDLVEAGGWNRAKERGLIRLEGKDYEIQDGDVVYFRFNV